MKREVCGVIVPKKQKKGVLKLCKLHPQLCRRIFFLTNVCLLLSSSLQKKKRKKKSDYCLLGKSLFTQLH